MTTYTHTFPVRVYYEDTDHGGVVYYANYLKFLERARTEFLRAEGIELDELEDREAILFAVTEAHIHYRVAARFNDELEVQSCLNEAKGARLAFAQRILRQNQLLIEADIRLACMDRTGRPKRVPACVLQAIHAGLTEESTT